MDSIFGNGELGAAIRRLEYALLIGIADELQTRLDETNSALAISQQTAIDMCEEVDYLTDQIAKVPLWPVHQTKLICIEFGDHRFENFGWNRVKREVATLLCARG